MASQFIPTSDWQLVPDGVAIPAGLDIRMDISAGGRWARLRPSSDDNVPQNGLIVADNNDESSESFHSDLQRSQLSDLEEKAYDYDDGAEIMHKYGAQLFQIYQTSEDPDSVKAGRILTVCLRNNNEAAGFVAKVAPKLASSIKLDQRSVSILSALVSTAEGRNLVGDALKRVQRELAYAPAVSPVLGRSVAKLLQNLAVSGIEDGMCDWVNALTQAYFTTKNESLREVAVQIVERQGDFSGLATKCAPQPGLLDEQQEVKRAAASDERFANPKARRNHFDEL